MRLLAALGLALLVAAVLIALSGANPLAAYAALLSGAVGSPVQLAQVGAKATPYLLCATGVALCFRARLINIGGEGQIVMGGMAAAWAVLSVPLQQPAPAIGLGLLAGAAGGMAWAGIAAALHLWRGVHEVLVTLLMNFVALLLLGRALEGPLGEAGAGFPQSPLLPRASWLPRLVPHTDLHFGFILALIVALLAQVALWHSVWGFGVRVTGASRHAARYAGISHTRTVISLMLVAGGSAGLAGAVQVLGIHHRLIQGFSGGFGFVSVAIALLGGLDPWALIPAALLFGALETGALSMQRRIGTPSSLVSVIEGLMMLFVLAAMASRARTARA